MKNLYYENVNFNKLNLLIQVNTVCSSFMSNYFHSYYVKLIL
jgi:hypothetical protein